MKHKQVRIKDLGISCDEKIADIVAALNEWGFNTNNSCQDNNDSVWLCFNRVNEVEDLLQVTLRRDHRFFEYLVAQDWELIPFEEIIYQGNLKIGALVCIHVSLRFPIADLEEFKTSLFNIFDRRLNK